jgi:hypothetical protein
VGEERVNREVEGGLLWPMHFAYLYKHSVIKPIIIVLRRGAEGIMI